MTLVVLAILAAILVALNCFYDLCCVSLLFRAPELGSSKTERAIPILAPSTKKKITFLPTLDFDR